ncbi:MAG TPA: SpoIIE family protein phosphatase [Rhodocyclaceae bacterium]|nr:SpoIIE family protein phosphatase [Rhodocyclaceae bacterium]
MHSPMPPLRVLAVDDNRTNLHILQVFLKKLGHTVISAENGVDAIAQFKKEKPDLVLLDIMMPLMDGFEAARRIKAMSVDRWVPIIFLSALNRDENLVEGLEAGGDDYLTKPVNFIVLEAKMRSMQRSLMLQQHAFEAYKRLQVISDAVLESIITADANGIIQACNESTELIFGWTPRELIGRNISVLMPEPYRSEHDDHVRAYVMGGPPKIIGSEREVEVLHKNGTPFPATLGVTEVRMDGERMFIGVIRDISEQKRAEQKLRENAAELQAYYEHTQGEQQLAKRLLDKQLHRRGLQDPRLHYAVIPAQNFSGDVVAAIRSNGGRLYALLADATGHGLAAAISVLPVLAIFYRMAGLDHSVREIVLEFNQQLRESMPVGRFVAATLVCLDESAKRGEIWVGGTPEAALIDRWGRPALNFPSAQLPLGILDNGEIDPNPTEFGWEPESQLLLCSDGLLEAESPDGQPFGKAGLTAALANTAPERRFDAIEAALKRHLDQSLASDDISIILVDCP